MPKHGNATTKEEGLRSIGQLSQCSHLDLRVSTLVTNAITVSPTLIPNRILMIPVIQVQSSVLFELISSRSRVIQALHDCDDVSMKHQW